ncbi:MAG: DNA polymerase III subunit delta [Anaerolineae bacterium]|nr:DNA polymerase III subunit delta [Anaerolineae bacterium]
MFYVFQGQDTFSCAEELMALKAKMGDPALADLNTTVLDGRSIDMAELVHHCDTIPFLADRRLVIVKDLLGRLGQRSKNATDKTLLGALVAYLPFLPSTTRLVFWEEHELGKTHPVLALAAKEKSGYVKTFRLPEAGSLSRWIKKRVQEAGGEITPGAVGALNTFVGNDLYQLSHEVAKLVAYVDGERAISEQDVALLTPRAREANIFDMVDALGRRDGQTASRIYHQLLDAGDHPLALLGMIARQFRLMIQIKELAPKMGTAEAIARKLRQNPYPVKKILRQSGNYTMVQLRTIYHKLLDTDVEIKTGQTDAMLALDLLIAGLSRDVPVG